MRNESAILKNKIKIGIDIHGVIDQAHDFFALFSNNELFEVHIITGIKKELDSDVKFDYHAWFSIHQECDDKGIEVVLDELGRPHVDRLIWDSMKADYCEREGIHMLIDDSPAYGKYFKNLDTMYLRLENTKREEWR